MSKTKNYGQFMGYLIMEEQHHWGYEVTAIPDCGEVIRKKFIGYTRKEMKEMIRNLIKEACK